MRCRVKTKWEPWVEIRSSWFLVTGNVLMEANHKSNYANSLWLTGSKIDLADALQHSRWPDMQHVARFILKREQSNGMHVSSNPNTESCFQKLTWMFPLSSQWQSRRQVVFLLTRFGYCLCIPKRRSHNTTPQHKHHLLLETQKKREKINDNVL